MFQFNYAYLRKNKVNEFFSEKIHTGKEFKNIECIWVLKDVPRKYYNFAREIDGNVFQPSAFYLKTTICHKKQTFTHSKWMLCYVSNESVEYEVEDVSNHISEISFYVMLIQLNSERLRLQHDMITELTIDMMMDIYNQNPESKPHFILWMNHKLESGKMEMIYRGYEYFMIDAIDVKSGKCYMEDQFFKEKTSLNIIAKQMESFGYIVTNIASKNDAHRCKYCGEITFGTNEDTLCKECCELFGHQYYHEL